MKKILAPDFNLELTLDSGQLFRHERRGEWWYISAGQHIFRVRQEGEKLYFDGADERYIREFFSLDLPYKRVIASISRDEVIAAAIESNPGLRLIRQDPWECAVNFICSANSNIPRIKKNISSIAKAFGRQITLAHHESYTFPLPTEIQPRKLHSLGLGYRSKYLASLVKKIDVKKLYAAREMNYIDAKEYISSLPGVGDKVGECILLFSLGHHNAFPVDVWIERAMKRLYNLDYNLNARHVRALGQTYFGDYAGYAQQFLFQYARSNKHLFTEQEPPTDESDNARKARARL